MNQFDLRPELFWDVDFSKLDIGKSKRLIIDRVLSLGTVSEFKAILKTYGKDLIKNEVQNIGYFDVKTFEFIVGYFGIEKHNMKCYIKKQSGKVHWN